VAAARDDVSVTPAIMASGLRRLDHGALVAEGPEVAALFSGRHLRFGTHVKESHLSGDRVHDRDVLHFVGFRLQHVPLRTGYGRKHRADNA
jgi:hypothetical protein